MSRAKQSLIEIAIELFGRHGYHAVGLDRLLDGAGVSNGGPIGLRFCSSSSKSAICPEYELNSTRICISLGCSDAGTTEPAVHVGIWH